MPLFTHGAATKPRGGRKPSLGKRLKRLFSRKSVQTIGDDSLGLEFIDKFRVMFLRSMIVLMIGCAWWVAAPAIFLSLLPGFGMYNQMLTNTHQTVANVYQFWQVVPEILLFAFSILWTGGVLDMMFGNKPFENVI